MYNAPILWIQRRVGRCVTWLRLFINSSVKQMCLLLSGQSEFEKNEFRAIRNYPNPEKMGIVWKSSKFLRILSGNFRDSGFQGILGNENWFYLVLKGSACKLAAAFPCSHFLRLNGDNVVCGRYRRCSPRRAMRSTRATRTTTGWRRTWATTWRRTASEAAPSECGTTRSPCATSSTTRPNAHRSSETEH